MTDLHIDGLNLNTGSAEDIDRVSALEGQEFEIVRYRGERGRFTALRQLEEVPGFAGKLDRLAGG